MRVLTPPFWNSVLAHSWKYYLMMYSKECTYRTNHAFHGRVIFLLMGFLPNLAVRFGVNSIDLSNWMLNFSSRLIKYWALFNNSFMVHASLLLSFFWKEYPLAGHSQISSIWGLLRLLLLPQPLVWNKCYEIINSLSFPMWSRLGK